MDQNPVDLHPESTHDDRSRYSFLRQAAQIAGAPAFFGNHPR